MRVFGGHGAQRGVPASPRSPPRCPRYLQAALAGAHDGAEVAGGAARAALGRRPQQVEGAAVTGALGAFAGDRRGEDVGVAVPKAEDPRVPPSPRQRRVPGVVPSSGTRRCSVGDTGVAVPRVRTPSATTLPVALRCVGTGAGGASGEGFSTGTPPAVRGCEDAPVPPGHPSPQQWHPPGRSTEGQGGGGAAPLPLALRCVGTGGAGGHLGGGTEGRLPPSMPPPGSPAVAPTWAQPGCRCLAAAGRSAGGWWWPGPRCTTASPRWTCGGTGGWGVSEVPGPPPTPPGSWPPPGPTCRRR